MKKIYLLSLSVFAAGVLNAQQAPTMENLTMMPASAALRIEANRPIEANQNRAGGDVVWNDEFDDAALWTPTAVDANNNGWSIGTTTTGWYFPATGDMGTTGNFARLTNAASATPANTAHYLTYNAVIDLSAAFAPVFQFEQYGSRFVTLQAVEVSVDGGTIWTEIGNNNDHAPLTATAGGVYDKPETRIYPLAAVIANNPSNVTFRFKWDGMQNGPNMNYVEYGWFVDNVKIIEGYSNNLVHENLFLGDIVQSYEYTKIPKNQGGFLTVQSALENLGLNTPTNVVASVTVTDAANTNVFTGTGGTMTGVLATGDKDTLTFVTTLDMSTLAFGVYTVTSIIESGATDEDLTNDTLVKTFEITENTYSHFNAASTGLTARNPGRASSTEGTPYTEFSFGGVFEIKTNQPLFGVDFYIASVTENITANIHSTTQDFEIQVQVFEENEDPTTGFQNPITKAQYIYNMADLTLGGWNTLNFYDALSSSVSSGSLDLEADKRYRVVIYCPDNGVLWGLGELTDTDFSSLRQRPAGWSGLTSELAIELNFDQTLTVNENNELNNLSVSQNVPNPFTGSTVVSYNLNETANVSVQVMDVTGNVVSTINEGNQAAGAHNITIDGSALAQGTYFYTLTAGTYQVTKRMVVSK